MLTKAEFDDLSPHHRGFAVYMMGERTDQPHVPNESNPYPAGSQEAAQWDHGQQRGVIASQDSP